MENGDELCGSLDICNLVAKVLFEVFGVIWDFDIMKDRIGGILLGRKQNGRFEEARMARGVGGVGGVGGHMWRVMGCFKNYY